MDAFSADAGTRPLSRLERNVLRLQSCVACLDYALAETAELGGVIFELGLGNGRSYHHLKLRRPGWDIYVFEFDVCPHPDSMPDPDHLIAGDILEKLPAMADRFAGQVTLVHADLGGADAEANARLAAAVAPHLRRAMHPEGLIVTSTPFPGFAEVPTPEGAVAGKYFVQAVARG